jgi:hypothetical protein
MSYCAYDLTARRLTKNGSYCVSLGTGYCTDDVVVFSAGRLVRIFYYVPNNSPCATYPVKYDSTARRLVRGTEAYVCYGYIV